MGSQSWHRGLLVGFDLETTGTDPAEARIVSAAVVEVKAGETASRREWLVDPGVPIPADAARIHGITDDRARAAGHPPAAVLEELAQLIAAHWSEGTPVVAFNAVFDLTLLSAELARHGLASLEERRAGRPVGPVLDPMTIDRAVDKYRRGSRTLTACCKEYGVALDHAHAAGADALAAVLLLEAIAERHGGVAELTAEQLHEQQVDWYAEWARGYQEWLRRGKAPDAVVDASWPLRPAPTGAGAA
ncbi:DNA polymerase III subunit epsilon [Mangrovactinospora gilvigrisea]|uniref:DNA polymerase III subunit epsilon n=1 Tax=Mangrovactinospora gilvigrisea TaxID=1428644 RepID=A0A1J7BQ59_9ACTN|nr:exonuclease domain-containing protein [Mangrovactinospora gilvigrisea]OIV35585.1 DNA polymerase III subunit epsilon [Mangrovactinospora gilvigrisea]